MSVNSVGLNTRHFLACDGSGGIVSHFCHLVQKVASFIKEFFYKIFSFICPCFGVKSNWLTVSLDQIVAKYNWLETEGTLRFKTKPTYCVIDCGDQQYLNLKGSFKESEFRNWYKTVQCSTSIQRLSIYIGFSKDRSLVHFEVPKGTSFTKACSLNEGKRCWEQLKMPNF